MKLWEKGYSLDESIERFTVGKDPELDMILLPYDIKGSLAHTEVLFECGVLTKEEKELLSNKLVDLKTLIEQGQFSIKQSDEDGHTAIENYLISALGELGKKIHTARSRNDQVLTALRLFEKDQINLIIQLLDQFRDQLKSFCDQQTRVPMPGFTHTRKAMPFTVAEWVDAFVSSVEDDLLLLELSLRLVDRNPLGTGAGYGIPLNIDREVSRTYLDFTGSIRNPLYAQNSRNKIEAQVLQSCTSVLTSLNKLCSDLILFTMPEFAFFNLPDEFTTGSSIMPHKRNPDVLELVRSSVHQVVAYQQQIMSTGLNLMSGYHRDVQICKEPLMSGLEITQHCIRIMTHVFSGLKINVDQLKAAMSPELYSVERVYELVNKGIPFREAYAIVSQRDF